VSTTWDDARRQAREAEDERYPEPEDEQVTCEECGLVSAFPHCDHAACSKPRGSRDE